MQGGLRFLVAAIPALAGIGAAIALARSGSKRRLGAIDPYGDTNEPEIDPADFEIAPGSYSDEENPSAPTRDEPGWEGGCLVLGKKHLRYGDPYRVCLTSTQEQKLFKGKRTKMKKLGCGVFACAYESPAKSRVVKFTRDSEDVAALLKAQKTDVVPKVHAVYKLKQGGRTTPVADFVTNRKEDPRHVDVYALVIDRLRTVPGSEREQEDGDLMRLHDAVDSVTHDRKPLTIKNVCTRVASYLDEGEAGPYDGCTTTQALVLDAIGKLRKIGINWTDFHAGNIGYDKAGRLKVLDLGVTKTALEKEPEILEGRLAVAGQRLNLLRAI